MGFLSSLFGVSDRTPKTSQIVQANKLPTEIAPYVKDVLGESQALYKADIERGYDPYTGETIAPFTPQEEQAMAGLEGLVGTQKPYLDEALETYRKGGDEFTAETAEKFMSPYQQAVTDIQLREAQENFEGRVMPQFEADAISRGGGPGGLGSRAGIEAAELQRGQSQLLSDIQAQGSQRAYADARTGYEAQKAREQAMATNVGRIGNAMTAAGLQEQGMLQTVGEQKRGMGQSILDEAYGKFLEEKNYPQQTLGVYSDTIYGAAPTFRNMNQNQTTSGLPGAPSMGQQLLGLGMAGANSFNSGTLGKMFGNTFQQKRAEGGPVIEAQSGLSLQEQLQGLTKQQGYFNPRGAGFKRNTAAGKRRADIQRSKNFLRGIQSEDEAVIQQDIANLKLQFPNMNPDELRQKATQFKQHYQPSQVQGGRGTATPPRGLPGLLEMQNLQGTQEVRTLEDLNKPKLKEAPSIYNTSGKGGQPVGQINPALQALNRLGTAYNIPKGHTRATGIGAERGGLKQIDKLGGGESFSIQQPDIDSLITAREKIVAKGDPRFNVTAQRKKKTDALNNMLKTMRTGLNKKISIQKESYTEDDVATEKFLNEAEASIKEDGATTSDIMAEAIDQGMKEPTIVTMLTKVLNTNEKGVQKRVREVNKELRELSKQKFIMEKESRKGKRTDKLANAESRSQIALRKISGTLKMDDFLDKLPSELKKQAMTELVGIDALKTNDFSRVMEYYKVRARFQELAILAEKNRLDAIEDSKTTPVKGPEYNALLKFFDTIIAGIHDPKVGVVDGEPIGTEARRRNAKINQIAAQILAGNMADPHSGKTGAAAARSYIENELASLRPITPID